LQIFAIDARDFFLAVLKKLLWFARINSGNFFSFQRTEKNGGLSINQAVFLFL
jgi:hypothetical protein